MNHNNNNDDNQHWHQPQNDPRPEFLEAAQQEQRPQREHNDIEFREEIVRVVQNVEPQQIEGEQLNGYHMRVIENIEHLDEDPFQGEHHDRGRPHVNDHVHIIEHVEDEAEEEHVEGENIDANEHGPIIEELIEFEGNVNQLAEVRYPIIHRQAIGVNLFPVAAIPAVQHPNVGEAGNQINIVHNRIENHRIVPHIIVDQHQEPEEQNDQNRINPYEIPVHLRNGHHDPIVNNEGMNPEDEANFIQAVREFHNRQRQRQDELLNLLRNRQRHQQLQQQKETSFENKYWNLKKSQKSHQDLVHYRNCNVQLY